MLKSLNSSNESELNNNWFAPYLKNDIILLYIPINTLFLICLVFEKQLHAPLISALPSILITINKNA